MSIGSTVGIIEQQRPPEPPVIEDSQFSKLETAGNQFTAKLDALTPVAGEMLLCVFSTDYAASGATFSTATTGWNFISSYGQSTADCYIGWFWKEAVGSDADLVIDSNVSQNWGARVFRISNASVIDSPVMGINSTGWNTNDVVTPALCAEWEPLALTLLASTADGSNRTPITIGASIDSDDWTEESNDTYMTGTAGGAFGVHSHTGDKNLPEASVQNRIQIYTGAADSGVSQTISIRSKDAPVPGQNNLILSSWDLTFGLSSTNTWESWRHSGPPLVTLDQPGLDGVANTATRVYDNSSNYEYIDYAFRASSVTGKKWTAKWLVRKDAVATNFPRFGISFNTAGQSGGSEYWIVMDLDLGTHAERGGTGTTTIQTYPHDTDFWEIVQEVTKTSGNSYAQARMYPAYSNTSINGSTSGAWGWVDVANVELYENCTEEDVLGNPAVKTGRGPTSGYVKFNDWVGYGGAALTNVLHDGGGPWVMQAGTIDLHHGTGNILYTKNGSDWAVADNSITDAEIRAGFFGFQHTTGPALLLRHDGSANGYGIRVLNCHSASPTIEIWSLVSNAWSVSLASTSMTSQGSMKRKRVDLIARCDSAGIYGEVTVNGGSAFNVEYLTTDMNDETHQGLLMYANFGDYWPYCEYFNVADYP